MSLATGNNGFDLKAGVYQLDAHIVLDPNIPNGVGRITMEIFDGTTVLKTKPAIGYIRANDTGEHEAVSTTFTFNLTTDKTIQLRIKWTNRTIGTLAARVDTGSLVTVRRLGT